MTNNVRLITNFENYGKEKSNRKRNHVVMLDTLPYKKLMKLRAFSKFNEPCTFTNQKGYTKECFTVPITDWTEWQGIGIISW